MSTRDDKILLSQLIQKNSDHIQHLIHQLSQRGFACIAIDEHTLYQNLEAGLDEASLLRGFRFPPIDDEVQYTDVRRHAFQALFKTAIICLQSLFDFLSTQSSHTDLSSEVNHVKQALLQAMSHQFYLFGEHFDQHEPFTHGQAFSQTFFNLFNYDHGSLNAHFDRSLLTVIKARSFLTDDVSCLWVEDHHQVWRNADAIAQDHEVIVMVGEDFEALNIPTSDHLFAAQHAVRVDPQGDYLSHSHFRADPSTTPTQNRLSAALILRHDPLEGSDH